MSHLSLLGHKTPLAQNLYQVFFFSISIIGVSLCMNAKSLQSRPALYNPMDSSPPGSSVHGILQARTLEWVAMTSSRDLPDPGIEPVSLMSPALAGGSLPLAPPGKSN